MPVNPPRENALGLPGEPGVTNRIFHESSIEAEQAAEQAAESVEPASLPDFYSDQDPTSPIRILVVEDNPETAGMIRILLEHNGYQVIDLSSGAEALDLIAAVEQGKEEPFDVALLDIMMPYVNGYEVCQEIRQTEQLGYIPILMVTALNSMEDMVHGLDQGADDYLVKPFNPRELLARVRAALRIRGVARAMHRRNWQLALINALNDVIGGSLNRDEVLRAGLAHLLQRLELAYVAAFVFDWRTDDITRIVYHDGERWVDRRILDPAAPADGPGSEAWQQRAAYQLACEVVTTGRSRLQPQARGWPAPDSDAPSGWRACVPLKTKSSRWSGQFQAVPPRMLGALLVGAPSDSPIIALDLLTAIGNQIGQALEKCHFYEQAHHRSEELTALYNVAQAINSSLDPDDILTTAMESIRQIVPVEAGSLLLFDQEHQALTFVRTLRPQDNVLLSRQIDVDTGIVGQVMKSGKPRIVNDVGTDPHFYSAFDQLTGFETGSVLCVPLQLRDQVIGVIELVNKTDHPFDERDVELVSSVAASVTVAMENSRLFHDLSAAYGDLENSRRKILSSRNRLQVLFDSISDLIYVVDGEYRIAALNAALRHWLTDQGQNALPDGDHQPDWALGRICYQTLYGRETPCKACQMAEVLHSGEQAQWTSYRRKPGRWREEWEISAYPIQGWKKETSQVLILARDVTEQRMLEASLSQSEKMASLGQLAAGLAHEINNPLTAIVANAQLLFLNTQPQDPRYESLDLIKRASDRAVKVVRNLLDFARQEQYEFQPTDINATLQSALELVRQQFLMAGVQVSKDLAPGLPTALVSRDHLQGVWLNLLLNARDAFTQNSNPKTEHKPQVWVSSRLRDDGMLEVTIRDNGAGIPSDQLGRIFEPFFTTKDPGKGTGLGLSTSFHVIKQHGGEIQVDSEVGVGTTFAVLLPSVT